MQRTKYLGRNVCFMLFSSSVKGLKVLNKEVYCYITIYMLGILSKLSCREKNFSAVVEVHHPVLKRESSMSSTL